MEHAWLKPVEVEEQYGLAVGTLGRWRHEGTGPRYHRVGKKLIRYRREDIETFLASGAVDPAAS